MPPIAKQRQIYVKKWEFKKHSNFPQIYHLGMMINSMGIGILISTFIGLLPSTLLARFGVISDVTVNIVSVALNTPTGRSLIHFRFFEI